MGWVWLGRLRGSHGFAKHVAIKTIRAEFAGDERFRRMFLDEARISAGIEHTNVAQIFDLGESSGHLYLVLEWVDGASLEHVARDAQETGKPVPLGIVLRIVADACEGLHAAHDLSDDKGRHLGIVHRDVSPHNILVSDRGVAKLIDFGVAKAKYRLIETSHGEIKGKLTYMAPEQAAGMFVDRRADVWAMGAVLHRMIAGSPPCGSFDELARFFRGERSAIAVPASVPEQIREVLTRALALDPRERYETAEALHVALEQAMVRCDVATTTAEVARYLASRQLVTRRPAPTSEDAAALGAGETRKVEPRISDEPPSPSPDRAPTTPPAEAHHTMSEPVLAPPLRPRGAARWIGAGALAVVALAAVGWLRTRDEAANAVTTQNLTRGTPERAEPSGSPSTEPPPAPAPSGVAIPIPSVTAVAAPHDSAPQPPAARVQRRPASSSAALPSSAPPPSAAPSLAPSAPSLAPEAPPVASSQGRASGALYDHM
jgi:serine/threonine-protein kinase